MNGFLGSWVCHLVEIFNYLQNGDIFCLRIFWGQSGNSHKKPKNIYAL